jgi:adenylate cyclase
MTALSLYAVTAAYRFAITARERRLIKRAFQHYVAPAIVEQMLNDSSRLKLGGEEYDVSVRFSDIEGFTTLCEHLTPAQLGAHLSDYFKHMLDVLLPHHGTLDKLIGDAIMMHFGCPHPGQTASGPGVSRRARDAAGNDRSEPSVDGRWFTRSSHPHRH